MDCAGPDEELGKLISAARSGDLEFVKAHVSKENLNAEGPLGLTLLGEACRSGNTDVVKFLIEAGADIGDVLTLACEYKDVATVNVLIKSGVGLDRYDKYGKTALLIAVERQSEVIVTELLKHGASVDKVDRQYCKSPLHVACETEFLPVVQLLLAYGPNVNLKDTSSRTPLLTASAKNRSTDVMLALLNHGASINETDRLGDTALHQACDRERLDMVRLLLQRGASVNAPNRRKLTPLHLAFDYQHITAILLDYGGGMCKCSLRFCQCETTVLDCQYKAHPCSYIPSNVFENHFIKVEAAGIPNAILRRCFPKDAVEWDHPTRDSYLAKCLNELEEMKVRKIGDSNSTYHDLIRCKKSALLDEGIVGGLSPSEVLRQFPIYGDLLYCNYLKVPKVVKRRNLTEKCTRFFELTRFGRLPTELLLVILDYLEDKDLECLVQIRKETRLSGSASETKAVDMLMNISIRKCSSS